MTGRFILLAAFVLLAGPAQADGSDGGQEPASGNEGQASPSMEQGSDGMHNDTGDGINQTSDSGTPPAERTSCEVVRYYGLARPTYVVVDPDRCFLPGPVRELVHRIV